MSINELKNIPTEMLLQRLDGELSIVDQRLINHELDVRKRRDTFQKLLSEKKATRSRGNELKATTEKLKKLPVSKLQEMLTKVHNSIFVAQAELAALKKTASEISSALGDIPRWVPSDTIGQCINCGVKTEWLWFENGSHKMQCRPVCLDRGQKVSTGIPRDFQAFFNMEFSSSEDGEN